MIRHVGRNSTAQRSRSNASLIVVTIDVAFGLSALPNAYGVEDVLVDSVRSGARYRPKVQAETRPCSCQ